MLRHDASLTRRDFLHAGSLSLLGMGLADRLQAGKGTDINCIMLFLVGGPSQIDTWDPKPDAPEEYRGPFRPIATSVPGYQVSELFPRLATHADKVSLVRSVHHTAAPVHDTGHQLMQTGRLFTDGVEHPHVGCVLGYLKGQRGELPAHVVLPSPIGLTGGNLPHGQNAGFLGRQHDPLVHPIQSSGSIHTAFDLSREPDALRDRYGRTRFGQSCLLARRLIEREVRFTTVNMFETVFDAVTWDIHGSTPFSDMNGMANQVAPEFDQAFSTLLEDLQERGLLATTMVFALGEFGRTPKVNPLGGRDHHPGVWTILAGGGPIQGGRIIGSSDELGAEPKTRPTTPPEVAATIFHGLGLDPHIALPGPHGQPVPLVEPGVAPIWELF